MINPNNFYSLVKSYEDPFSEGLQYVLMIEHTQIFNYDKRKNKKQYECDVYKHSFRMNTNLLQSTMGLDEREFFIRLMQQPEDVKGKFDYESGFITKLYGDDLVEVGNQLSKYTHKNYFSDDLVSMCGYPYSR